MNPDYIVVGFIVLLALIFLLAALLLSVYHELDTRLQDAEYQLYVTEKEKEPKDHD